MSEASPSPPLVIGWDLNLAAELELLDPAFVPSGALRARIAEQAQVFLELSNRASRGAILHVLSRDLGDDQQAMAFAWMAITDASRELLIHTNHRRFGWRLGRGLERSTYVDDVVSLQRVLDSQPFPVGGYILKRPLGFSGRGRKRLRSLKEVVRAARWIEASMTSEYGGGLLVEPFVHVGDEFSWHGYVPRWGGGGGACIVGDVVVQRVDPESGAWLGTQLASDAEFSAAEWQAYEAAHDAASDALREVGYSGPFAIDAYRYRDVGEDGLSSSSESGSDFDSDSGSGVRDGGEEREWAFCALSELNVRYTMGYVLGMDSQRERWLAAVRGTPGEGC